jgi:hypothetical protein
MIIGCIEGCRSGQILLGTWRIVIRCVLFLNIVLLEYSRKTSSPC